MKMYVFKDQNRLGPFEATEVEVGMARGEYLGTDLGYREGDSDWQPLSVLFPDIGRRDPVPAPPASVPEAPRVAPPVQPSAAAVPPLYRSTTLQKVFFGLAFLGSLLAAMAAFTYRSFFLAPSGNLQADLSNIGYRDLLLYATAGFAGMAFFCFLAFVLTFKSKVISSSGVRIVLRLFFIVMILIGLGSIAYGALSYLSWRPSSSTTTTSSRPPSAADDLLKALETSESVSGPFASGAISVPVGLGLLLFGSSGVLMTTSKGRLKN